MKCSPDTKDMYSQVWNAYVNPSAESNAHPELTLYQALTHLECTSSRKDKVQYICEPMQIETKPDAPLFGPEQFENFLGLVWRVVVLDKVQKARQAARRTAAHSESAYVRVVVATCPLWAHVVDKAVFFVQADPHHIQASRVRAITAPFPNGPTAPHDQTVENWVRTEVRKHARRGGRAIDYICSLLSLAVARRLSVDTPLYEETMKPVLNALGMRLWARWRTSSSAEGSARKLNLPPIKSENAAIAGCLAIFVAFLDLINNTEDLINNTDEVRGINFTDLLWITR